MIIDTNRAKCNHTIRFSYAFYNHDLIPKLSTLRLNLAYKELIHMFPNDAYIMDRITESMDADGTRYLDYRFIIMEGWF
jgi:hypothetical protein